MNVLMISGSRNPEGQTARAAEAILAGATEAGAGVDRAFLPAMAMERCRQCNDDGWGLCRQKGQCVIEDDFAGLVERVHAADAVLFANPVYYGDLSESLRAFLDRLRRTCTQEPGRALVVDKRAIAVCVAGGGGGGAPACCASLEKVLRICGFDLIDTIPVRRQNLESYQERLRQAGKWLATPAAAK
jgi:multimeric flavodoxin WrbA